MYWARPAKMAFCHLRARCLSGLEVLAQKLLVIALSMTAIITAITLSPIQASASISLIEVVRTALEHAPGVLMERQTVRGSESTLQNARSAFDPQATLSVAYSSTDSTSLSPALKTVTSTLSLSTLLPSGLTVSPSVSVQKYTQHWFPTSNMATAGITFTLPLLQGLGNNASTMVLEASRKSYKAEGYTLQHTAAASIYAAANAYWNYVYTYRTLNLAHQLLEGAEESVRATKALAAAGEAAKVRTDMAEAYFQQAKAVEVNQTQLLHQSWSDLFLAMGISTQGRDRPEDPLDAFPVPDGNLSSLSDISKLKAKALASRADYLALQLQSEAAKDILAGSRNGMKPKIDLLLYAGYNGENIGSSFTDYVSSLTSKVPGSNVSATLRYTVAAGNHSNEAAFIRSSALHETAQINSRVLERSIDQGVRLATESVKNTAAIWLLSTESAKTYRFLNTVELKKYRIGISDLFKVQSVSTDLGNAENQLISAEKAYAVALLSLRFQLAALMRVENGRYSIEHEDLVTIPTVDNIIKKP